MQRVVSIFTLHALVLAASCDATTNVAPGASASERSASSSAAEATPPKPRTAKITKSVPKVGDKETQRKTKEEKMTVAFKGPKGGIDVDSIELSTVEKTEECLEAKEGVCSKLKVTYAADNGQKTTTTRLVTLDGKADPKDKPKPPKETKHTGANEGNVYIVTRDAKSPVIAREDGKKPTKAEIDAIQGAYRDDGSRGRKLVEALPDEVKVGDSLDAFAKILAGQASEGEAADKPKVVATVTVKEIRDVDGKVVVVLALHIEVEGKDKRVDHMKLVTDGTIEILADGALPQKSEHTGALQATLPRKGGELRGTTKETTSTKAGG